jgi:hypothetical protein
MTVCIAALYDNGKGCVLASDQMTTAHFPIGYEFESTDIAKIIGISESAYMLVAGDVLFADEVITEARERLGSEGDTLTMSRIVECVRSEYQEVEALVRAAKKRSEVAPGVGNETAIVSI